MLITDDSVDSDDTDANDNDDDDDVEYFIDSISGSGRH